MAETKAQPAPVQTQTEAQSGSPPVSGNTSPASASSVKRSRSPMSIDLSSLPPLSQPSPPSNTLIITRLHDPKIFHPASLATVRQHINDIAPLNSFSPLKSMERIICSFYDDDSAVRVRQAFDGKVILGQTPAKCYFGEPTPIDPEKKYLDKPDAGKLFFISPPPSPPIGWESKEEDPPNKEVHAEDLATKLQRLTGRMEELNESPGEEKQQFTADELKKLKIRKPSLSGITEEPSPSRSTPMRSRSSTLIYDPVAHGDSPALPAVMLETEDDSEAELDSSEKRPMAHTARPPVELME